jgi:hypothetical protein
MTNHNHADKLVHAKSHPVVLINSKRFEGVLVSSPFYDVRKKISYGLEVAVV